MSEFKGRLESAESALRFALAGKATLTLQSVKSGTRFTYRLNRKESDDDSKPPIVFVSLLSGADNESDYQYLGHIFLDGRDLYQVGRKSRVGAEASSQVAFKWTWEQLRHRGKLPESLEIWHEGRCGRCNRTLTVPESVASGFGPECVTRIGVW